MSCTAGARSISFQDLFNTLVPDWLRQVLVAIVILTALMLILLGARRLWREWKLGEWYGSSTKWRMLPLKEITAADAVTGIPTDTTLDALSRLGLELEHELWQPKLLLLRPTPPANHEPAIIDALLSDSLCDVLLAPQPKICAFNGGGTTLNSTKRFRI